MGLPFSTRSLGLARHLVVEPIDDIHRDEKSQVARRVEILHGPLASKISAPGHGDDGVRVLGEVGLGVVDRGH
jgi:GMP synthase PP-ATPase subunit